MNHKANVVDWNKLAEDDIAFLRNNSLPEHPHMDWVHSANPLSDAECDNIIAIAKEFPLSPTRTVGEDNYPNHRQAEVRMLEPNEKNKSFFKFLYSVALNATSKHFQLTISGITRCPQYVEYT